MKAKLVVACLALCLTIAVAAAALFFAVEVACVPQMQTCTLNVPFTPHYYGFEYNVSFASYYGWNISALRPRYYLLTPYSHT